MPKRFKSPHKTTTGKAKNKTKIKQEKCDKATKRQKQVLRRMGIKGELLNFLSKEDASILIQTNYR